MAQAPSMPVFTDALIGDTLHLTTEEFGAYCLLLFATWRNNGEALTDNDVELSTICRVPLAKWKKSLKPKLIRFFNTSDGRLHQKRLEKEWAYVQERADNSRRNGSKGGRPRNPDPPPEKPSGYPNGYPDGNPDHNPHETRTEPTQPQAHTHLESIQKDSSLLRARARPLTVLSAAERKARWQSRMMQEAQATMAPKLFGKLVEALMGDPIPQWAKDELERLDRQIKDRQNGAAHAAA